ncbi:MAG: hypothetical protein GXW90_06105 [Tepidanaerobacter acetatoxydans]|jgi:hypothetical protein|uniref:hypothetical protein n=1 Tax=Tepidanaerobacter TaxID=499228 RepID=UPI000AF3CBDB|nr:MULTISPECIES: hypothetical protein [Tepidanaerobacter]NLU10498.1 hypothetical protein [Tepidanaerobacter acetatoxydans]
MYENDLSSGMIPGRLTFESYEVDKPLQRDQVTQFIKLLNNKGITTFMGKPSEKGGTAANEIVGIVDVPPSNVVITDDMFDELAKDKGTENPTKSEIVILNKDEIREIIDLQKTSITVSRKKHERAFRISVGGGRDNAMQIKTNRFDELFLKR